MPTSKGVVTGSTDVVIAPREAGAVCGISLCNLSPSSARTPSVIVRTSEGDDVHLLDEVSLPGATTILYDPPGGMFELERDDYLVISLAAPISPGIAWLCNWK